MRTIRYLIQKEWLQIIRNRGMLPILILMPLVQLLILSHVATFDIHHLRLFVIDQDATVSSRSLVNRFLASGYFICSGADYSGRNLDEIFIREQSDLILIIPPDFERDITQSGIARVQFNIHAVDGNAAQVMRAYAARIVQDYQNDRSRSNDPFLTEPEIQTRFWYNPELDYKTYMVPGILAILVTVIGVFLSGVNIVREKENGTIEQLNVTPIRRYEFIAGKLIPFWLIGLLELAFGLIIAKLVFSIPVAGSVPLLFGVAAIYLLAMSGIGLLISTIAATQHQAMFIAWFFMVIFILLSGFFTPVESMPDWAQGLTRFNPMAYFIKMIRAVLIKGSDLYALWPQITVLGGFAVFFLSLAVWRYRKVSA